MRTPLLPLPQQEIARSADDQRHAALRGLDKSQHVRARFRDASEVDITSVAVDAQKVWRAASTKLTRMTFLARRRESNRLQDRLATTILCEGAHVNDVDELVLPVLRIVGHRDEEEIRVCSAQGSHPKRLGAVAGPEPKPIATQLTRQGASLRVHEHEAAVFAVGDDEAVRRLVPADTVWVVEGLLLAPGWRRNRRHPLDVLWPARRRRPAFNPIVFAAIAVGEEGAPSTERSVGDIAKSVGLRGSRAIASGFPEKLPSQVEGENRVVEEVHDPNCLLPSPRHQVRGLNGQTMAAESAVRPPHMLRAERQQQVACPVEHQDRISEARVPL
mmetsp:Transcript_8867/g.22970  ORF Transcript_8867/g.22970 Transcript_8867/m.22970 type:complete len:330 (-) Transcript_8867:253-1242(-)